MSCYNRTSSCDPLPQPGRLVFVICLFAAVLRGGELHRSPVDIVLGSRSRWAVTANATANSISLVDPQAGRLLDEQPTGKWPSALAMFPDSQRVAVACRHDGTIHVFRVEDSKLKHQAKFWVGGAPAGIAVGPGDVAYVSQSALGRVVRIDLKSGKTTGRLSTGRWPRAVQLTGDARRLLVACSGDAAIWVIDTRRWKLQRQIKVPGINLGQFALTADNRHAYFPWMQYRRREITRVTVGLGLVLGSRLGRIWLDPPHRRMNGLDRMSLDPPGNARGDPVAVAVSPDGAKLAVSVGGTGHVMMFRLPDLKLTAYGGSRSFLDRRIAFNHQRLRQIEVGGRPMGLKFSHDSQWLLVANYLQDRVDRIQVQKSRVAKPIELGRPKKLSLARRGEAIFLDATRSMESWFSCQTCHFRGGGNSVAMATSNDDAPKLFKTVLPLFNVTHTKPWTWHGWQKDLHKSIRKSMVDTMLGAEPDPVEVDAVAAYLKTLRRVPNPYRDKSGKLGPSARRGERVFRQSGCANCHAGQYYSDGGIHDVGLGSQQDKHKGFNTPSLLGVYAKTRLLHDGRGRSLEHILTGPHAPRRTGAKAIRKEDLQDLIQYLRSL